MKILQRLAMAGAVALTTLMPFANAKAAAVRLESQVNVANVTAGDTQYQKSVNAKVDEVVKIQVWYHNMEEADSGLVADNLKVKIDVPTAMGKTQTVTSTVDADNANTVTDTATFNLSLDRAFLEVIPGSAVWRHNTGDNQNVNYVDTQLTQSQQDQLLGGGLVLEDAQPCFNFEATVTVLARVKANAFSVTKMVRVDDGSSRFAVTNTAKPGQTLQYVITIKNEGNTVLPDFIVRDNLPAYLTYVPGSTKLVNSNTGSTGRIMPDGITTGGITIDSAAPGGVQLVYLKAKLDQNIKCGDHDLRNVAVAHPTGQNELFNVAITKVNVACITPAKQPLPETGMEGTAAGSLGTGAMGYALATYRRSKRALLDALRK